MKLIGAISAALIGTASVNSFDLDVGKVKNLQNALRDRVFINHNNAINNYRKTNAYIKATKAKSEEEVLEKFREYNFQRETCRFDRNGDYIWEQCKQCIGQQCTGYYKQHCGEIPNNYIAGYNDDSEAIQNLRDLLAELYDQQGIELLLEYGGTDGVSLDMGAPVVEHDYQQKRRKRGADNDCGESLELPETSCEGEDCGYDFEPTVSITCVDHEAPNSLIDSSGRPFSQVDSSRYWKVLATSDQQFSIESTDRSDGKTMLTIDFSGSNAIPAHGYDDHETDVDEEVDGGDWEEERYDDEDNYEDIPYYEDNENFAFVHSPDTYGNHGKQKMSFAINEPDLVKFKEDIEQVSDNVADLTLEDFQELISTDHDSFCDSFGGCRTEKAIESAYKHHISERRKKSAGYRAKRDARKEDICPLVLMDSKYCRMLSLDCEECNEKISHHCPEYTSVRREVTEQIENAGQLAEHLANVQGDQEDILKWYSALEDENGDAYIYIQKAAYNKRLHTVNLLIKFGRGEAARHVLARSDAFDEEWYEDDSNWNRYARSLAENIVAEARIATYKDSDESQ